MFGRVDLLQRTEVSLRGRAVAGPASASLERGRWAASHNCRNKSDAESDSENPHPGMISVGTNTMNYDDR